jgi:hypothetical protein
MDAFQLAPPLRFSGIEREIDTEDLEQEARILRSRIRTFNQQILDVGRMRNSRAETTEAQLVRTREKLTHIETELKRLDEQFAALPGVGRFLSVLQRMSMAQTTVKIKELEKNLRLLPNPFGQNDTRSQERLLVAIRFLSENIVVIKDSFEAERDQFQNANTAATLADIAVDTTKSDIVRENATKILRKLELLKLFEERDDGVALYLSTKDVLFILSSLQEVGQAIVADAAQVPQILNKAEELSRALADTQVVRDAGDAIRAAAFLNDIVRTFSQTALPGNLEERLLSGNLSTQEAEQLRDKVTNVLQSVQQGSFDLLFGANRIGELRASLARTKAAIREGHKGINIGTTDGARNITQKAMLNALTLVSTALLTWTVALDRLDESAPSLDELQRWFRERSNVHPDTLRSVTKRVEQLERVRLEMVRTIRSIEEHGAAIVGNESNAIRDAVDGLAYTRSLLISAYQDTTKQIMTLRAEGRQVPIMRVEAGQDLLMQVRIEGGTAPYFVELGPVRALNSDHIEQLRAEVRGSNQSEKLLDPDAEYRAVTRFSLPEFNLLHAQRADGSIDTLRVTGEPVVMEKGGTLNLKLAPVKDWHTGAWKLRVSDSGVSGFFEADVREQLLVMRNTFIQNFLNGVGLGNFDQTARNAVRDTAVDAIRSPVRLEHLGVFPETDVPLSLQTRTDIVRWLSNLLETPFHTLVDSQQFDLVVVAAQPCVRCGERFSQLGDNVHGACEWNLVPTARERDIITRSYTYTPAGKERNGNLETHPAMRERDHLISLSHKALSDLRTPDALRVIARESSHIRKRDADSLFKLRQSGAFRIVLAARTLLDKLSASLILLRDVPVLPVDGNDESRFFEKINAEKRRQGQFVSKSKSLQRLQTTNEEDTELDRLWSEEAFYIESFSQYVDQLQVKYERKSKTAWRGRHSLSSNLPTPPSEFRPSRRATESIRSGFNYMTYTPERISPGDSFTGDERLFMQASQFIGLAREGHSQTSLPMFKDKWAWARDKPDSIAERYADRTDRSSASFMLRKQLDGFTDTDFHFRGLGRKTFTLARVQTLRMDLNMLDLDARDPAYAKYVEQSIFTADEWRSYEIGREGVVAFQILEELYQNIIPRTPVGALLTAVRKIIKFNDGQRKRNGILGFVLAALLKLREQTRVEFLNFRRLTPSQQSEAIQSFQIKVQLLQHMAKDVHSLKRLGNGEPGTNVERNLMANLRKKPIKVLQGVGLWRGDLDAPVMIAEPFAILNLDDDTDSDIDNGSSDTGHILEESDDDTFFPTAESIDKVHVAAATAATVIARPVILLCDSEYSDSEYSDKTPSDNSEYSDDAENSLFSDEGAVNDSPWKVEDIRTDLLDDEVVPSSQELEGQVNDFVSDDERLSSDEGNLLDSPWKAGAATVCSSDDKVVPLTTHVQKGQMETYTKDLSNGKEEEDTPILPTEVLDCPADSYTSSSSSSSSDSDTNGSDFDMGRKADSHGMSSPFADSHGLASPFSISETTKFDEPALAKRARGIAAKALATSKAFAATKASQCRQAAAAAQRETEAHKAATIALSVAAAEKVSRATRVAKKAQQIGAQIKQSKKTWEDVNRNVVDKAMSICVQFENDTVTTDSLQTWMSNMSTMTKQLEETGAQVNAETSEQLRALHHLKNSP